MTNASRDTNNVTTILATLNSSGASVVPIKANASNHALKVVDSNTGSDNGPSRALRDENFVTAMLVESSANDGSLVALYGDSSGNLLIQST